MAEYSDSYEIAAGIDSLIESSDFEGANCLRIAFSSLLFEGRRAYVNEIVEQVRDVGITNIGLSEENLIQFTHKNSDEKKKIAATLFRYSRQIDNLDRNEIRKELWLEIIEKPTSNSALFAFSTISLLSTLERESLISAVALLKAIPLLGNGWHVLLAKDMFRKFSDHPLLQGISSPNESGRSLRNIVLDADLDLHDFVTSDWVSLCDAVWVSISGGIGLTKYLSGIVFLSHIRLIHAKFAVDEFSREIAKATFAGKSVRDDFSVNSQEVVEVQEPIFYGETLSTIVHGTFAHTKMWWRPTGDFFDFAKRSFSPELYSGTPPVTWEGFPSFRNLKLGAKNLEVWYERVWSPRSLKTIFTHSYGGDIVARAILRGMPVEELVLLSATVTDPLIAAISSVPRVIDIRIHFDFVLWGAGVFQKLPENLTVDRITFSTHFWRHSCTHDVGYWQQQRIARRIWS